MVVGGGDVGMGFVRVMLVGIGIEWVRLELVFENP